MSTSARIRERHESSSGSRKSTVPLLLDVIDGKRAAEHASSVWDRSMSHVKPGPFYDDNPSINRYVREPGHIEYASKLGLGVYDIGQIQVRKIEL